MVNRKKAYCKYFLTKNITFLFNSRSKRLSLSLNVCYIHPEKYIKAKPLKHKSCNVKL